MSLPVNKSSGLYLFHVRILKLAGELLASPLVTVLNKSVESGAYSSKLEHAIIIPTLKK